MPTANIPIMAMTSATVKSQGLDTANRSFDTRRAMRKATMPEGMPLVVAARAFPNMITIRGVRDTRLWSIVPWKNSVLRPQPVDHVPQFHTYIRNKPMEM